MRYGVRTLIKKPGFTAIAIFTLALGIGANTAIFSIVNAVLLKPLPYPNADRVVAIQEFNSRGKRSQSTPANFLDWREQNTVFEQMAAILTRNANLTGAGDPERISVATVSASFFQVLGSRPIRGRDFTPEDEVAGHAPVAIIGYAIWQSHFGGDESIIGISVVLDSRSYQVVGVTPAGFDYPFDYLKDAQVWIPPLRLAPELRDNMDVTQTRGFGFLSVIARLKDGVTFDQAESEMTNITARLREQYPNTNNDRFNKVVTLQTHLVGEVRPVLLLLLGAVFCVLLIACANVANLLLVRATGRQKEIAIRSALGANRFRVIRQLLTESVILALVGGVLGLLLALWSVDLFKGLATDIPRINEVRLDTSVLAFTFGMALLSGLVFGVAPALQFSKPDVYGLLKESARPTSAPQTRLRNVLVVAEVALSLMLLVGAGLLLRSFINLQSVKPGFESEQILTFKLAPSGENYRGLRRASAFHSQVIERLRTLPGVQEVGAVSTLPLRPGELYGFRVEGEPPRPADQMASANFRVVNHEYFQTLGIPLLEGRGFTTRDTADVPDVYVVNQEFVRRNFPNESPLGKRISFGTDERGNPYYGEIVGVVADMRTLELKEDPTPDTYSSYLQSSSDGLFFVIRTNVEPLSLAQAIRNAVMEVDKNQPISEIKPLDRIVYQSVAVPRFNLYLLGVFAALAMLLATAGIYGVISYSVSQRTHEIGIRLALGARTEDVLAMIIKQGMKLTLAGISLGLIGAYVLTGLIKNQLFVKNLLFQIGVYDKFTFLAVPLILAGVALVACLVPARRATKVDPMVALRYE
jgi:putative ABC transport system permease protein